MADLDKTIERLQAFNDRGYIKEGITVFDDNPSERKQLIADAIELLKEYKSKKRKPYESHRKLPCLCGWKRVETWYGSDGSVGIKCPDCELSVKGKSEIEAIRAWNKLVGGNGE